MTNNDFKILIVDDEEDILEFVGYNLRKEGYTVITASNGTDAVKLVREHIPHLIILDIMMPGMDGIETCREIRATGQLNNSIIAYFTARSEDYSQIAGFEAGADDYITKPMKPRLLVSKVAALLRRHRLNEDDKGSAFTAGDLLVDFEKYHVIYKGRQYFLPRKEFELLAMLASRPNRVFTREEIFNRLWGDDVIVGERTMDVHIRKIREKLNMDNIKTIKGVGYKFEL